MWRVLHVRMSCIFLFFFFFLSYPYLFSCLSSLESGLSAGAVLSCLNLGWASRKEYIGGESLAVTRCVFVALIGTPVPPVRNRSDFACGRSKFAQIEKKKRGGVYFRVFKYIKKKKKKKEEKEIFFRFVPFHGASVFRLYNDRKGSRVNAYRGALKGEPSRKRRKLRRSRRTKDSRSARISYLTAHRTLLPPLFSFFFIPHVISLLFLSFYLSLSIYLFLSLSILCLRSFTCTLCHPLSVSWVCVKRSFRCCAAFRQSTSSIYVGLPPSTQ